MCNSISMFSLLGEELCGDHDDEVIRLPGGCSLLIQKDCSGTFWYFTARTGSGKMLSGGSRSRDDAFDRAMDFLAEFIN